jgi:2-dehydro-3-deoxygluconokinase
VRFDVVSLGEPLYEFSQIPGRPREFLQGFGGDTMNCAIAAARQGARVAYLTRLGDDEFGRQFLELWKREGLDASGVGVDPDAHTAVYFISHGPSGHQFSYLRKGSAASKMQPEHLRREVLTSTRYFHTSGITQAISRSACDTVEAAIEIAKNAGARFVYDANIRLRLWSAERARAVIGATLAAADLFLLSKEDADVLCGPARPEEILDWCHRKGARQAVLKLGAAGALASDGSRCWRVASYRVDAVDATGAGDCFAGAAMARLAAGDRIAAALDYASAAAALACTGFGAVEPLPRPEAVRALMAGHVAARPPEAG